MAKVILVASGKGGAGKSTVTAFLSEALSDREQKVLVAELDAGFRCLDVSYGIGSDVVYDLGDILSGNASVGDVSKPCPFSRNVSVICAPQKYRDGDLESFDRLRDCFDDFAFVLLDCPAGNGKVLEAAAGIADCALVVATADPSSVRAAKRTSEALRDLGISDRRLVIERCPVRPKQLSPFRTLDEIIDQTELQLIGVVWEDRDTRLSMDTGSALPPKNPNRIMFADIAGRLMGERINLGIK